MAQIATGAGHMTQSSIRRWKGGNNRTGKHGTPAETLVYNISDTMLTLIQLNVLQKGLSSSPTSVCDIFALHIDLHRFYHNLRLKRHFAKTPTVTGVTYSNGGLGHSHCHLRRSIYVTKVSLCPPQLDNVVEAYIKLVNKDVE